MTQQNTRPGATSSGGWGPARWPWRGRSRQATVWRRHASPGDGPRPRDWRERSHQRRLRRVRRPDEHAHPAGDGAEQGARRRPGRRGQRHLGQTQAARPQGDRRGREIRPSRLSRGVRAAGRGRRGDRVARSLASPAHDGGAAERKGRLPRKADDLHRGGSGEIADAVQASGRVLQVGSQYTSMDHFWKAKKAIQDGLLGEVVWASGGFGRNRNQRGEWNYAIDPEATDKTLDWKAFIGPAPKRAFDPERYFRWRKYWDYSGGIATDLFYHTVSPLLLRSAATSRSASRVGRHLPAEGSRGARHVLHERGLSRLDDAAGVLGRQRSRRAARDPWQPGHVVRRPEQREPHQYADGDRAGSGIPRGVRRRRPAPRP